MTLIAAVLNSKGGVGKTTTSIHLATALDRNYSVEVWDADPQGSASEWMQDAAEASGDDGAVFRIADTAGGENVTAGDLDTVSNCAHYGLGGLGHMAVKLANAMGAKVVLFTTSPDKAADAAPIAAAGKRVVYLSIENAWPLGEDVSLIEVFHQLGVRMSGFAHFRTNQFADSATDKPKWDGLSPLGVQLLAEMNRTGVVPDLSHSSDAALADALRLSKTPVSGGVELFE